MRPLRVLQSFPSPRPTTNPYIIMLDRSLAAAPGVEHHRFDWRTALLGRYDVLHFHWPETLFNSATPVNRAAKRVLFLFLLIRLRFTRIAVVRTVHNLALPTDITPFQRRLLLAVERRTVLRILIGETTTLPAGQPSVTILHGDYRPWFSTLARSEPRPGRIGFVGLIRRYKGVEQLIDSFRALRSSTDDAASALHLAISGNPTSAELAQEIRARSAGDPAIDLHLSFLDDQEFVTAMTESELVVLPYRFMHNSGSVLAALSLDRPVLVPRNAANEALAREVGESWILMYDGEIGPDDLRAASDAALRRDPSAGPDLSARGWDRAGADHVAAYAEAVRLRATRRPGSGR